MSQHNLKFAPSILARLGEELLPNFDQGIIELVRNSYDADALECTVTLNNVSKPGGSITIRDTGIGMDRNKIESAWLVLGHSSKRGTKTTPNGRIQVGDKGLGRLAALRMGTSVIVHSYPEQYPNSKYSNEEHNVELDWVKFDQSSTVDEISVEIESLDLPNQTLSGTTIIIRDLKQKISKQEAERLARSLMLLSNPFEKVNDFKLKLVCSEYPELEKLVKTGYLSEAEFVIKAKLNSDGTAEAEIYDWKDTILWKTSSSDWFTRKNKSNSPTYKAPRAEFELSIFQLDNSSFATRAINKRQVSTWLKAVGGVHVYHNDFRVHPYGDEGSDWLDMNLARVNSPSIRPSTNTSIGRISIFDESKVLQQKTDRVGFIEDENFHELKRFITDALNWYANQRTQLATKIKEAQKSEDEQNVKDKESALKEAIQNLPDPIIKKQLRAAFKASKVASLKQTKHLKEDLKLYRSLATAGTTTAVFSHEISKPIAEIPESLSSAERLVRMNSDATLYKRYKERTSNILGYLSRLSHFAELQLDLLKRNKRRNGVIEVVPVILELLNNFQPLLDKEVITINFDHTGVENPKLNGSICILEAIITNCLTNSMRAFRTENFDVDTRTIEIHLAQEADNSLLIRVSDNGPGITELSTADVWLPGITTIEDGTGFGLTIVKDSVSDLGGRCRVDAKGHLGGATFYFEFITL
ncbi:ATP-binding protein [Vibrio nomapromontoriensis]|uniref:ATP-binding protein n=1 Tax=Vibrio nomapromontoriensis TaxID=2910246 RepID=UPI003D14FD90